jgi:hypothetical protein
VQLDWKKILIVLALLLAVAGLAAFLWSILHRNTAAPDQGGNFGLSNASNTGVSFTDELPSFTSNGTGEFATQAIFKIAEGPILSATLVQTLNPTTTIARYITAEDGHVLEVSLDSAGAAPHIASNTTIPGLERALWTADGRAVIAQYLDQGHIKSALLNLPVPQATATTTAPASIRFLPDDVGDVASSPDGTRLAYLLRNGTGADGYTMNLDGSNTKKLFSLPLHEILLSWPASTTLFAVEKTASGAPTLAFSINTKTGATDPLLYGLGLTASANPLFSSVLYRSDDGSSIALFAETPSSGATSPLPLADPALSHLLPESCVWSTVPTLRAFCTAPVGAAGVGFLDLWHRGEVSAPSSIVSVNPASSTVLPVATPGSSDGGEASDVIDLSVSPDGHYLSFISKNTGSLWGVRLSQ